MIAIRSLDHHYPRPTGKWPSQDLVQSCHSTRLTPSPLPHLLPCFCKTLLISLLWTCQSNSSSYLKPYLHPSLITLPHYFLTLLLSCHSLCLHPSFHLVGILYRQCQSPVVSERKPGPPRPLSLVQPSLLGAQRERFPPVHRTVLMRTNSLPSNGLRFPSLLPVDARLLEGYGEDDYELREYFC